MVDHEKAVERLRRLLDGEVIGDYRFNFQDLVFERMVSPGLWITAELFYHLGEE